MKARVHVLPVVALLACALALSVSLASAQTLESKLDEYMQAAVKVQKFQGSVAVARAGKPIFAQGYGPADLAGGAANNAQTIFLLGSVTKQFTSAAIMQLVEQGKIALDAPMTTYLTDYPKATGDRVTIHHLLTHTSGIPSYTSIAPASGADLYAPISREQVIAMFKDLPLEFEPGTQWRYNNSGYFLLGLILEKVSGEPYTDYLQKHMFDPLGMKHTGYCDPTNLPENFARPHTMDSTGKSPISWRFADMTWPYAAGGLYSNVGDMLIWGEALAGGKVVSRASLDRMQTPVLNKYGYGLGADSVFGRQRISHGGDIDGFTCMFERYPSDSLTVVVLSNNDRAPAGAVAVTLAAIALGQPYELPVVRTPVALDSLALLQYVGVYEIEEGQYRVVTRVADTLFAQRTGGAQRQLHAEAADKFYYDYDNTISLVFLRNASGTIDRHSIYQAGVWTEAMRITGPVADSLLALSHGVTVDPAILAQYTGEYELMPGFMLAVTVNEGRIFAQATGQQQIELHARSNEIFAIPQVGAEITFVKEPDGKVMSLVLVQGGQKIPAKRIK